jgi:chromosome segregation ATPase
MLLNEEQRTCINLLKEKLTSNITNTELLYTKQKDEEVTRDITSITVKPEVSMEFTLANINDELKDVRHLLEAKETELVEVNKELGEVKVKLKEEVRNGKLMEEKIRKLYENESMLRNKLSDYEMKCEELVLLTKSKAELEEKLHECMLCNIKMKEQCYNDQQKHREELGKIRGELNMAHENEEQLKGELIILQSKHEETIEEMIRKNEEDIREKESKIQELEESKEVLNSRIEENEQYKRETEEIIQTLSAQIKAKENTITEHKDKYENIRIELRQKEADWELKYKDSQVQYTKTKIEYERDIKSIEDQHRNELSELVGKYEEIDKNYKSLLEENENTIKVILIHNIELYI